MTRSIARFGAAGALCALAASFVPSAAPAQGRGRDLLQARRDAAAGRSAKIEDSIKDEADRPMPRVVLQVEKLGERFEKGELAGLWNRPASEEKVLSAKARAIAVRHMRASQDSEALGRRQAWIEARLASGTVPAAKEGQAAEGETGRLTPEEVVFSPDFAKEAVFAAKLDEAERTELANQIAVLFSERVSAENAVALARNVGMTLKRAGSEEQASKIAAARLLESASRVNVAGPERGAGIAPERPALRGEPRSIPANASGLRKRG